MRTTVDHLSTPLIELEGAEKPFRFKVAMVIFARLLLFLYLLPWVGADLTVGGHGCVRGRGLAVRTWCCAT